MKYESKKIARYKNEDIFSVSLINDNNFKINFYNFGGHIHQINIPYHNNQLIQTTIGQLNFFKWAMENEIIDYINNNYNDIEKDMNNRNSTSKRKINVTNNNSKTRKKREELSVSASKTIKEEKVEVTIKFD